MSKKYNNSDLVLIVKRKLWTYSYRVSDYSEVDPVGFDLLIDGKIKVKVEAGIPSKKLLNKNCDVVASVANDGKIKFITRQKISKNEIISSKKPYDIFGRPKKS